ncbi:MAG: hypothetical protein UU67_C0031G0012 [Candidatus Daviesbacteria bacterium GW2011_GWB1_41_5]|uniref:Uncharacterized protein n=2 Tax=Candidatus Daviesiibacteriota TaxID=1752718 RepID=A0A0G0WJZ9_9BACT|nr:MAG: hypothetical protein UU67_C0031G0012 [Candidatus Daviesbacteria bacterium GW2011_GWB1_41_5]
MLNAKAFANAAAAIMAIWVAACATLSYIAPDLLFSVTQSWTHSMNLEGLKSTSAPDLGSLVFGFITAVGLTWITIYGTISLYNKWAKKG